MKFKPEPTPHPSQCECEKCRPDLVKKVYCKNCVFLAFEGDVRYYNSIRFNHTHGEGQINLTTPICIATMKKHHSSLPGDAMEPPMACEPDIIVDNPYVRNRLNTCRYYEKMWFKFWVK